MRRVEDGWHHVMGHTVYVRNNRVLYGMTRYGKPIRPYRVKGLAGPNNPVMTPCSGITVETFRKGVKKERIVMN